MIEVINLTKSYRRGNMMTHVLKGVSFRVRKGEFVAIMGPSGSGKSTLLNILGLLDQPDSGNYLIDGVDYAKASDETRSAARSRMIGFVFQQFHLLDRASALRNVTLPLLYSETSSDGTARAERALEAVGLGHRKHYLASELSGGEQQRVAIARALINAPPLILADEATGNLDAASGAEVLDIFRTLVRGGRTIVLITHDRDVVAHADRVVSFNDGRMAGTRSASEDETRVQARQRPAHDSARGRWGNFARGSPLASRTGFKSSLQFETKISQSPVTTDAAPQVHGFTVVPRRPAGDLSRSSRSLFAEKRA